MPVIIAASSGSSGGFFFTTTQTPKRGRKPQWTTEEVFDDEQEGLQYVAGSVGNYMCNGCIGRRTMPVYLLRSINHQTPQQANIVKSFTTLIIRWLSGRYVL